LWQWRTSDERYQGRTDAGIRDLTKDDYRRVLGLDAYGRPNGKGACDFFGDMPLSHITLRDVSAYVATIRARGLARNSIRLAVAPLRCLFRDAAELGDVTHDPTVGVRLGGRKPKRGDDDGKQVLTLDELARLYDAIPEDHRLFVRFLAATGLRIAEATGLEWRHLDDDGVNVVQRLYRGSIDAPKTEAGARRVPLPAEMVRELKKHRLASGYSRPEDFVFSSTRGGPMHASNFRRRVLLPAFDKAELKIAPGLCFHLFRRSCGTWLGSNEGGKVDLADVAKWLGHEDTRTTLRHYIKPAELKAPAGLGKLTGTEAVNA
jgi:integrase